MKYQLYNADCLDLIQTLDPVDTLFADPPDNLGLSYHEYQDRKDESVYVDLLRQWLSCFVLKAKTVWFSYNAKWTFEVGKIVVDLVGLRAGELEAKPCVQTYTFGQHNQHDLGNNYRPLLRLRWRGAPLFPDAIRIPSWRQENGDKRADPRGRVPGDVFDFTRVTGNSKQRRPWHPTQLNEGLVERCLRLTTPDNGRVLDPFGGTGTTLRVCKRINLPCTLIEVDREYCRLIAAENDLHAVTYDHRAIWTGAA